MKYMKRIAKKGHISKIMINAAHFPWFQVSSPTYLLGLTIYLIALVRLRVYGICLTLARFKVS